MPVSRLVDPALVLLVALAAGLALLSRRAPSPAPATARARRLRVGALVAAWGAFAGLWLGSSPWFARALTRAVEAEPVDLARALAGTRPEERALVVLSGGVRGDRGGVPAMERLGESTLLRSIGAARVYREHGFGAVIITGRGVEVGPEDMARGMADVMVAFGVPRAKIVLETAARDTKENARYSAAIVRRRGFARTVVATSAAHIPRAVWEFRRSGLAVVAAPVDFAGPPPRAPGWWLPSSDGLRETGAALHEVLGRLKP